MANTFDAVKVREDLAAIQDKILDIVDELEDIQLSAESSSGKIKQLIPQNLMVAMDKLINIVDGAGPDSLSRLVDLIGSIPLKDLEDQRRAKRSDLRKQAQAQGDAAIEENLTPDTDEGPKSEIAREDLSSFVKGVLGQKRVTERALGGLSFNNLLEDGLGGDIDGNLAARINEQAGGSALMPASAIPSSRKIRERIEEKFDGNDSDESVGGSLREIDVMSMKVPGASIGMPGIDLDELV